jgi:hypothetical protein
MITKKTFYSLIIIFYFNSIFLEIIIYIFGQSKILKMMKQLNYPTI